MKFRISRDAKSNAGKLLDALSVHQFENGRVAVIGRINGRQATWEGSLGDSVTFVDAEAEEWLLHQNIDWIRHGAWLDRVRAEREEQAAKEKADRERRQADARKELAIIQAAQIKYATAVEHGYMTFDGTPQIASIPGEDGRKWVQAWVLVEVSA
jgi:hypothetical protein